jgi:lysophospholipase L1-like esterase
MPLAAIRVQPVCRRFEFAGPQNRLALTASDGPVTLLSFATFRNQPGVALSNLGVIGTQLGDFAARDDEVMRAELEAYAPDLIVLAYGTNDGFADHVDGPGYETAVRDQIRRLRRLSPGTPVLLLGAPDANTLRKGIRADGKEDRGFDCSPLTSVEIADFARLTADRSPQLARWFPPAGLAVVRDAQKRAAEGEGAAFWDWAARMGGPCSAHRLSHSTPRLVMGDHVHFTTDGGDLIAGLLWQDLTDAYTAQMGGR